MAVSIIKVISESYFSTSNWCTGFSTQMKQNIIKPNQNRHGYEPFQGKQKMSAGFIIDNQKKPAWLF